MVAEREENHRLILFGRLSYLGLQETNKALLFCFINVENSVMWSWCMGAPRILIFVIFRSTFLRSIRSALKGDLMLKALYPASFRRYSSLAILGPMVDGFSTWLLEHHYNHTYIKQRIWLVPYIEAVLSRRGIHYVKEMFRCSSGRIAGPFQDEELHSRGMVH